MLQTIFPCTHFFDTRHCGNTIKLIIFSELLSLEEIEYLCALFVLYNPQDTKK